MRCAWHSRATLGKLFNMDLTCVSHRLLFKLRAPLPPIFFCPGSNRPCTQSRILLVDRMLCPACILNP